MKIQSSNVQLSAVSQRSEYYTKSESVEYWSGDEQASQNPDEQPEVVLDLKEREKPAPTYSQKAAPAQQKYGFDLGDKDRSLIDVLQRMIEALTGKRFRFHSLDGAKFSCGSSADVPLITEGASNAPRVREGWGLIARSREYYRETESMSFSANGTVQTADGKSISFAVDVSMSREFAAANSFTLRAGEARLCDPLVINFDGPAAALSSTKFSFDLDADGKEDQISSLLGGSGFLALDKNGDGAINDGNELFGTKSGDGFADLSAYDSDGNMWIDENDPIYDKLRIWVRDESGESRLLALGEKGVGAIYLGKVGTEYGYKNEANETQAQLRSTGVFLRENGTAGTIQHVDMAI